MVGIAADDEDAVRRADILQAPEELLELRARGQAAGGDVGDRDEAEFADGLGRADAHLEVFVAEEGHVDLRAGRDAVLRLEQARHVLARHLERVAVHQFESRLRVGHDVRGLRH